ncbi:hypothetical protein V8F20_010776 [Naviculisporaceae sp. PSN 640]
MTTPHPPHTTPALETPLPTARQFLASLFNAISEIPLIGGRNPTDPDESSDDEVHDPGGGEEDDYEHEQELNKRRRKMLRTGTGAGNVLKQVPVSHRHLIITLHVLFPGLVLPALDLLDRGLVGHIKLKENGKTTIKKEQAANNTKTSYDKQGRNSHLEGKQNKPEKEKEKKKTAAPAPAFYLVRSAQPTSHHHHHRRQRRRQQQQQQRFGGSGGEEDDYPYTADNNSNNLFPGGQRAYIVRLDAWNCTCAAFAFASFSEPEAPLQEEEEEGEGEGGELGEDENSHPGSRKEEWSFGGMTLSQRDEPNDSPPPPPLCKHLLACLLAERWNEALGRYVVERQVSKEEMAGIVAEI